MSIEWIDLHSKLRDGSQVDQRKSLLLNERIGDFAATDSTDDKRVCEHLSLLSTCDGGVLIIPMLTCVDTAAEIAFCKQVFGAALLSQRLWTDGRVIHATLAVGQALFMVHGEISHLASQEPKHDGSSSVVLYLYLSDPDKTIDDAVLAGASILLPVKDEPWGDRVGRIMDPAGHVWNIARSATARLHKSETQG